MTGTVTTVPGCKCNATLSMLKMTNLTSTTIGAAKLATIVLSFTRECLLHLSWKLWAEMSMEIQFWTSKDLNDQVNNAIHRIHEEPWFETND